VDIHVGSPVCPALCACASVTSSGVARGACDVCGWLSTARCIFLETNAVELQKAIYYLIESQIQARTMARVKDDYAFRIISPAIAPDLDRSIRPNRLLIIVFGIIFGIVISLLSMFIAESLKKATVKA
jgi:hypothetical protein